MATLPVIAFKIFLYLVMFIGAFLLFTDIYSNIIRKKRKLALSDDNSVQDKDGLPILPRHLRSVSKETPSATTTTTTTETKSATDTKAVSPSTAADKITNKPVTDDLAIDADNAKNITSEIEDTKEHSKDSEVKSDNETPHPVITDLPLFKKPAEEEKSKISLVQGYNKSANSNATQESSSSDEYSSEYYLLEEEPENNAFLEDSEKDNLVHSPLLQKYLSENYEPTDTQHSPLMSASDNLNISIVLDDQANYITGQKLLELVDAFGFKFGAMNMFHRYQNKDGTGVLWFSMLGLTEESIVPFDLNTLPEIDDLTGLVIFLPLPHPKVLQGFDSMMSIAGLIAREVDGYIVDEYGDEITVEYRKELRNVLKAELVD